VLGTLAQRHHLLEILPQPTGFGVGLRLQRVRRLLHTHRLVDGDAEAAGDVGDGRRGRIARLVVAV
jgi:hypothetical protein